MPMPAVQRLLDLLGRPDVELDRVAAVIGAHLGADPGENAVAQQMDDFARELGVDATADEVIGHVFGTLGFQGNTRSYYEAENSLIQHVLVTRRGVPLTLALVAIEIGRRAGATLSPVGMPGHFLIGDGKVPTRYFDPFAGGRILDSEECREIFERLVPGQSFHPQMLRPVSPVSIGARMLQNLRVAALRQGDVSRLAAVLQLRVELPGASIEERLEYSKILGALGRFDQAAEQRDLLARLQPEQGAVHRQAAGRHRARRN